MALLLRIAELLICGLLIVWTMIFPLATLLSLAFTLPLFALLGNRQPVAARARRRVFPAAR